EEEQFFEETLQELRVRRQTIREETERLATWRLTPPVAVLRVATDCLINSHRVPLVFYDCGVVNTQDHQEAASELRRVIEHVTEPYVAIASRCVSHDAAFFSSAADWLLDDATLSLDGIFLGAYLAPAGKQIEAEIFTKQEPAVTFERAVELLPE